MAVKIGKLVTMAMALGALTIGCGDDTPPGVTSEGSSTGTGSTGPGESTTMVADDSTTAVGSGSAEGTGSSSSSSGEPPPVEVTVEGEVVDFTAMGTPIPDAEISLFEDPSINTVAGGDGTFSIGPLMAETTATFVVNPTPEYWGAIIPIDIGADPLQEDVQLSQIPSSFVDFQIMLIEPQMPVPANLDEAIVIVRLINNTAVSEGPTTIEMTPAPDPGTFYAPDAMGAPVVDQNTIEFAALPVVVYYNVPDTAPGDISITATHPVRECEVLYPQLPTIGQHITLIDIQCLPPA